MKTEDILDYYYHGWELSKTAQKFPLWFELHKEKIACLLGYNDADLSVERSKEEILQEVEKLTN